MKHFSYKQMPVKRAWCLLSVMLLCACAATAQDKRPTNADGTIVEQVPCAPRTDSYAQFMKSYEPFYTEEVEAAKRQGIAMQPFDKLKPRLASKEEFERRKMYAGMECRRIKYMSDNLKVVAHIWKPQNTDGKKLPLIIYNRGGNREFGKNADWMRSGFYTYVSQGFVVIASQYRGNDGGEGREEFGGADVKDVMNLIPLAKSLGYVDMNNVFLLGGSRGGMMTYLALKDGFPANAAAVVGGVTDLASNGARRPEMMNQFRELMPDFDKRREEHLQARSAVRWAERINVPVLILHGGADWRVETNQALTFAQRLQQLGKNYELIIYAKDDHGLSFNRTNSDDRIVEWFKEYMK